MRVVPRLRWNRMSDGVVRLDCSDRSGDGERLSAADGTLLVLATDTDDDAARLQAGEALSHLLLSATTLGLASCTLTEPLGMRDRLALACDLFDAEAHPQVLIRVGLPSPDGSALPPPPRRSVAETTIWTA
jgi:nitroreductase